MAVPRQEIRAVECGPKGKLRPLLAPPRVQVHTHVPRLFWAVIPATWVIAFHMQPPSNMLPGVSALGAKHAPEAGAGGGCRIHCVDVEAGWRHVQASLLISDWSSITVNQELLPMRFPIVSTVPARSSANALIR